MKYIIAILFFIHVISTHGQNSLLSKTLISDWSEYPIYPELIEEKDGRKVWKEEYSYLDSIHVSAITYLSDSLRVKGLLVAPKQPGNYPCIIYNRGGNREFGSLKVATGATFLGQIASQGYIVIASQYRGNAGGEGMEEFGGKEVNDVIGLVDVLAEIENADTSRIGMFGWSRGGMMTYIALTKTDKIKAAAVGGAVSDLFETIEDRPEMETGVIAELIPNYEENKEAELEARSAVKWADKFPKNVPILMMHGTSDWRVKPEQSLSLAMEFEKYRVPYRLIMFEGGDHGIREHRKEVNEQVVEWFDRFLKDGEALPNMDYHGR